MVTLANAENYLKNLIASHQNTKKNMNEAETRFHLIDELITQCFGWDKDDIKVEQYQNNNGYTDYELGKPRQIIIEAKREGQIFSTPPLSEGKNIIDIPSLLRTDVNVEKAIKQAQQYGSNRGCICAVVTNGHQFIIFLPTNINGQDPLVGKALIYNCLDGLLADFLRVWDCISKDGIREKRILNILGEHSSSLAAKFSNEIISYPKPLTKSEFCTELSTLAQIIIQDYMNKPELERSFFENCYCESGALSSYSMLSKKILSNRYANLLIGQSDVLVAPVKTKKEDKLDPKLFSESMSDRPIVLIGDVGVGKTSFIKNLTYSSAHNQFKKAIYIYIDLGSNATLSNNLKSYILESISDQLRDKYGIAISSEKFIMRALREEVKEFDNGIYGKYKESNSDKYQEKLDEYLYEFIQNKKDYFLKKSIDVIVKERRQQVIICIDNADQRTSDIQNEAFIISQELAKQWKVLTFVTMRPLTFYNSKNSGVMAAYPHHVFTISPPRIDEVIIKRLNFAKKITTGEERYAENIGLNLENLSIIIDIMIETLNKSERSKQIYEFIENIMGGNVRKALEFIVGLIGSPGLDSEEIINKYKQESKYILPLHEFTKYALLENNFYYDSRNSLAMNLFDIRVANNKNEHFIICFILSYINEKNLHLDFVPFIDVLNEVQNLSFSEKQIIDAIYACIHKGLIEKEDRIKFGNKDFEDELKESNLRITSVGIYHIKKWIGEFAYLDSMLFDTPILDNEIKSDLRKYIYSRVMFDRYMRATGFKEYLIAAWNSLPIKPTYFDFLSVLESEEDTFQRVAVYMKRKYSENDS